MPIIDTTPERVSVLIKVAEEERIGMVRRTVLEAAYAGLEVLAQAAPRDLGLMRMSGHVVTVDEGYAIDFDAPHSGIVELGSRPHMPPVEPLKEWVLRHLDLFGATEEEADGIAWAIAKKIEREGTKPTHFVMSNLPKLAEILDTLQQARLGSR